MFFFSSRAFLTRASGSGNLGNHSPRFRRKIKLLLLLLYAPHSLTGNFSHKSLEHLTIYNAAQRSHFQGWKYSAIFNQKSKHERFLTL